MTHVKTVVPTRYNAANHRLRRVHPGLQEFLCKRKWQFFLKMSQHYVVGEPDSACVNVAFLRNVQYLMFPLLKYICLHAAQNAFDYSISLL